MPERFITEREEAAAQPFEIGRIGMHPPDCIGEGLLPLRLEPRVERGPMAPPGLEEVIVDDRHLRAGKPGAKLRQGPDLEPGGDRDDGRGHEIERLPIDDPRNDRGVRQVVVDDRDQHGPQRLQILEIERIHDREALAQNPVPDLDRRPGGKIVRIGAGQIVMPEEIGVGVVVNALDRHILDMLEELGLIAGDQTEHPLKPVTGDEAKRCRGSGSAHAVTRARRFRERSSMRAVASGTVIQASIS
ncbi:MAG TPA: hypothetical protein VEW91_08380 [bacterium]|nr:hypothetical protein [bacterium]